MLIFSCSETKENKSAVNKLYGKILSDEPVKSFKDIAKMLKVVPKYQVKVSGIISEYEKGKGFWLVSFKKSINPIFVSVDENSIVLPDNIKGKTVIVEGLAVKVVTTELKHLVKAGYSFNVQVWCPMGKEADNEEACIKVEECCRPTYGLGIEFKKDDLGAPFLHTKIVASGVQIGG